MYFITDIYKYDIQRKKILNQEERCYHDKIAYTKQLAQERLDSIA